MGSSEDTESVKMLITVTKPERDLATSFVLDIPCGKELRFFFPIRHRSAVIYHDDFAKILLQEGAKCWRLGFCIFKS